MSYSQLTDFKEAVAVFAREHPQSQCEVCRGYDRVDLERAGAGCECGAPLVIHSRAHPHSAYTEGCLGFCRSDALGRGSSTSWSTPKGSSDGRPTMSEERDAVEVAVAVVENERLRERLQEVVDALDAGHPGLAAKIARRGLRGD